MAEFNIDTEVLKPGEYIDEIVLICENHPSYNYKENEESGLLKRLSLSGFKSENFNSMQNENAIDTLRNLDLNDENLPKANINIKKKEHNGVPFIRTGRSANRPVNCNKENISVTKDKSKSANNSSIPSASLFKKPIARVPTFAQNRAPMFNKTNIRAPLPPSGKASTLPVFRAPIPPPKVRPASTLPHIAVFQKSKPSTMPKSPRLSTSIRAEERNKFNMHLKERETELRSQKLKEEDISNKENAKKMEILRKNLVHKPEPIRKYNP